MFPIPTKRGRYIYSSYSVVFLPNRRLRLRSEHAHASVHAQATIQFGLQMVHESFWLRPTCLTPLPRESRGPLRNRLLDKRRVKSTKTQDKQAISTDDHRSQAPTYSYAPWQRLSTTPHERFLARCPAIVGITCLKNDVSMTRLSVTTSKTKTGSSKRSINNNSSPAGQG